MELIPTCESNERIKRILNLEVTAYGVKMKVGNLLDALTEEEIVGMFEGVAEDLVQRGIEVGTK